jgi:hypothetical protein
MKWASHKTPPRLPFSLNRRLRHLRTSTTRVGRDGNQRPLGINQTLQCIFEIVFVAFHFGFELVAAPTFIRADSASLAGRSCSFKLNLP